MRIMRWRRGPKIRILVSQAATAPARAARTFRAATTAGRTRPATTRRLAANGSAGQADGFFVADPANVFRAAKRRELFATERDQLRFFRRSVDHQRHIPHGLAHRPNRSSRKVGPSAGQAIDAPLQQARQRDAPLVAGQIANVDGLEVAFVAWPDEAHQQVLLSGRQRQFAVCPSPENCAPAKCYGSCRAAGDRRSARCSSWATCSTTRAVPWSRR